MSRKESRENALKLLYSDLINQSTPVQELQELFLRDYPLDAPDLQYWKTLISGVTAHAEALDRVIDCYLTDWTVKRIPKLDLLILRIALYEILYIDDVPNNVAIAEAVRLSKLYCDDDARLYINAVLGHIERKLKGSGMPLDASHAQDLLSYLTEEESLE